MHVNGRGFEESGHGLRFFCAHHFNRTPPLGNPGSAPAVDPFYDYIQKLFAKMKILPVIFMALVALGLLIPACSGDGGGDDSGTLGAAAAVHSYLLTK